MVKCYNACPTIVFEHSTPDQFFILVRPSYPSLLVHHSPLLPLHNFSHPLSHSHPLTLTPSHFHTLSLSHPLTLTPSHFHTLSHSHPLTHTPSHFHTSHTHTLSLSHPLTRTPSHFHTSLTHPLSSHSPYLGLLQALHLCLAEFLTHYKPPEVPSQGESPVDPVRALLCTVLTVSQKICESVLTTLSLSTGSLLEDELGKNVQSAS